MCIRDRLLGVFIFFQAKSLVAKQKSLNEETAAVGYYFIISCFLNFVWLLSWQSMHLQVAFILIFVLWIVLIMLYYRLSQIQNAHSAFTVPFSFYLAWICVAGLANLNVVLIDGGFNFFGLTDEYWTALLILIGLCGTLLVLYLNQDIWFTLVLMWAFYGVYYKSDALSNGGNAVTKMALIAILSLMLIGGWVGIRKWTKIKTSRIVS